MGWQVFSQERILQTNMKNISIEIIEWISNYIDLKKSIHDSKHKVQQGFGQNAVKLGHGWLNTFHIKLWMQLLIHAHILD